MHACVHALIETAYLLFLDLGWLVSDLGLVFVILTHYGVCI